MMLNLQVGLGLCQREGGSIMMLNLQVVIFWQKGLFGGSGWQKGLFGGSGCSYSTGAYVGM